MTVPTGSTNFALSQEITACLHSVRSMLRRYIALQGLFLVVLWLLLAFWLGGLLDYLPVTVGSNETPRWLRIGLLVIMVLGSGWILWRWVFSRLAVRLTDEALAVAVERRYPELNSELVTTVELSRKPEADVVNAAAHAAMLRRVHDSVSARIGRVSVVDLFEWQPVWGFGIASTFGILLTLTAWLGMPEWMNQWSQRLFALSDEPWPRRARLRADGIQLQVPAFSGQLAAERVMLGFVDDVARVPIGSAAMLQIAADADAPAIPEVCTLFYRSDDGTRGRANLRRIGSPRDGWQRFTLEGPPLDGLTSDLSLDVVGLDARIRDLQIEVVQPVVISELNLQCRYPVYLLDEFSSRHAQEKLTYRSGLSIPEGTDLTLIGNSSDELGRVDYVIYSADRDDSQPLVIEQVSPEKNSFAIPVGRLSNNLVVEVRLIDRFGLSAQQIPRYVITMQEDKAPEVNSQLNGIGLAVTADAMLPLVGTVTDDHGIRDVYAELAINESDPLRIDLPLDQSELNNTVDLQKLQSETGLAVRPGATLGLVVTATDNYDLDAKQHVGRGQPVQLAVVTSDELLVMLDRQELELRQRLELIVGELEQLRDVLQTLKSELNTKQTTRLDRTRVGRSMHFVVAQPPSQEEIADGAGEDDAAGGDESEDAIREDEARLSKRRLASLWAQQSVLQADKSQQELSSVAARVDNLRAQLVNNRIDSYDRQERLQTKVHDPLRSLLAGEYEQLRAGLAELQTATLSGDGAEQSVRAATDLDTVLIKLEEIKANMQDIEDFNELVDLVRDLLGDQEKLLTRTEEEQRRRVLDLLKLK